MKQISIQRKKKYMLLELFSARETPIAIKRAPLRSLLTQVVGEFGIDELKQGVQVAQLSFDVRLIHVKILLHSLHQSHKTPERVHFVLHDNQDRTEQIVHALHVTFSQAKRKRARGDRLMRRAKLTQVKVEHVVGH